MSLVNTYRGLEQEIARLTAQLEKLKESPELQREAEFEAKLRDLMTEYGKDVSDIATILGPVGAKPAAGRGGAGRASAPRAQAKERTFKNPHDGEVLTLKKLNSRAYRAWVEKYGADVVAGWEVR